MGSRDNLFNLDDFVPDGGYPYPWPPEECYVEEEQLYKRYRAIKITDS